MTLFLTSVIIALTVSFACSLLEACVLSLSLTDVARIHADHPRVGPIWRNFKENIQRPIAVILIVNTTANTMGAAISSAAFDDMYGKQWLVAYSIVFSLVAIQFCEILPKTLGVRFNRRLAAYIAAPLSFVVWLLSPVVWLIQLVNRPFTGRASQQQVDAMGEILTLTRFAAINKVISPEQAGIISRSMNLSKNTVRDIMVDRDEIRFLSAESKMHEAFLEAHIHRHTRYLLVENGDLNRVLGYVNFKDIVGAMKVNPRNPTLRGIVRPVPEIRPDESLIALLNLLTKNHQHFALVRSAGGATEGLVTLEDVMEAIVGDIQDEFDVLPAQLSQLSKSSYLAGGGVRMAAVRATLGSDFPDTDMTLSEWLRHQSWGQRPKVDTVIRFGAWDFAIRRIRRSAVFEVTIDRAHTPKAPAAEVPAPAAGPETKPPTP